MLEAAELEFNSAKRQQAILQQELGQVRARLCCAVLGLGELIGYIPYTASPVSSWFACRDGLQHSWECVIQTEVQVLSAFVQHMCACARCLALFAGQRAHRVRQGSGGSSGRRVSRLPALLPAGWLLGTLWPAGAAVPWGGCGWLRAVWRHVQIRCAAGR